MVRPGTISLEPSRAGQDTPFAMLDRPTIESLRKRSYDLYQHFKLDAPGIAEVAKKFLG
jgi:hypothetical protein